MNAEQELFRIGKAADEIIERFDRYRAVSPQMQARALENLLRSIEVLKKLAERTDAVESESLGEGKE